MRIGRSSVVRALCAVVLWAPCTAAAQNESLSRALDLETAGKCREAITSYREALRIGDPASAVLGLERCYGQLAKSDSLLPLLDSLLAMRPRDPTIRSVQLRTLTSLRRDDAAEEAFQQWYRLAPRDATPFREYARLLLDMGRAAKADTVIRAATSTLGSTKDLAAEVAEMQSAMGLWVPSARSWRQAVTIMPFMEMAAVFALYPAPIVHRDSIRAAFLAPPLEVPARKILAGLETRWRSARDGWAVLAELPKSDSALSAWIEFGNEAEQHDAWLTARDAFAKAIANGGNPALAFRAAAAALNGGEPASALGLLANAPPPSDSVPASTIVLLRVRAFGALGRAQEAASLLESEKGQLDSEAVRQASRAIAWGWVRAGDLVKARAAITASGEEDERAEAWMALYEGNLKTARIGLRRTDETTRETVIAMALLSRTRKDTSLAAGHAFLALARGDSAGAAQKFQTAAGEVTDAAPLLLGQAARLLSQMSQIAAAESLWKTIIERHADAPEAAEADLEWARALRRRGDGSGAIARLEHLILTYPQSALVPQARRELDLAKGTVPPNSAS
jgi:tetratricopeptide (TPR) repeat protein